MAIFRGGDAIIPQVTIDPKVKEILELSDRGVGQPAAVANIEALYDVISAQHFSVPPKQPEELSKYGFGLKNGINAVIPYCVSSNVRLPIGNEPRETALDAIFCVINSYPIFAGSAIFLGVKHPMCEDVDLVKYIIVGTRSQERQEVAQEFFRLNDSLKPNTLKVSLNNTTGNKPSPRRSARGELEIKRLLELTLGTNPRNPDPQAIAKLASAQLAWEANSFAVGKPVSLQLHFLHKAFTDKDVHPQQEVHECDAGNYMHTNQHWLAPSFLNYFQFLIRGIQRHLVEHDKIKASKRAVMLLGLVGDTAVQGEILRLIDDYLDQKVDAQQNRQRQLLSIIENLRKALTVACNE